MKSLLFIASFFVLPGVWAQPDVPQGVPAPRSERLILEEKHFVECLAYVYSPPLWISYRGSLYFAPKDDTQARQIDALKVARSRYVAFTDRKARHDLAASALAASGIDPAWQKKLLLPYSDTQQNLTPTLNRAFHTVNTYKIAQTLEQGDVLIQEGDVAYLVMDFARAPTDVSHTNLYLIKEGERAFGSASGEYRRVEAFSNIALSKDETRLLNRVVVAFQNQAAALGRELAGFKAHQEFEDSKTRATDSNPYLQYLVARAYLDGTGTDKNEQVGLEWMNKAARNGSGDAKAFLQTRAAPGQ